MNKIRPELIRAIEKSATLPEKKEDKGLTDKVRERIEELKKEVKEDYEYAKSDGRKVLYCWKEVFFTPVLEWIHQRESP